MKMFFRKLVLFLLTIVSFAPKQVYAVFESGGNIGIGTTGLGPDPVSFKYLETIYENILGIILSLAGVAIFVMLTMAGFKFLTAGGNAEQAKSAKSTITWAVIGLIVMLMVWFVIKLIEEFTGVKVTEFEIPGV